MPRIASGRPACKLSLVLVVAFFVVELAHLGLNSRFSLHLLRLAQMPVRCCGRINFEFRYILLLCFYM
jgi:hypothetical protein